MTVSSKKQNEEKPPLVSGPDFPLMEVLKAFIFRGGFFFSSPSGSVSTGPAGLLLLLLAPLLLLLRLLSPHHFGSICCFLVSRRIWREPLVIVSLGGHAPRRHLHANYRQMYTHPFVCRGYTFNLRPWNEQKCFLSFFFTHPEKVLFNLILLSPYRDDLSSTPRDRVHSHFRGFYEK